MLSDVEVVVMATFVPDNLEAPEPNKALSAPKISLKHSSIALLSYLPSAIQQFK